MKTYLIIHVLACFLPLSCNGNTDFESLITSFSQDSLAEDGKLNFTQLAEKYGHSVEQYEVITEDDYILHLFYIPGKYASILPPLLLFHGICDVSDTFVIRGYSSLAITLANEGYGVWISNNRGTKYGRKHVTLNPDTDEEFWDYSFHEVGYYDAAAIIDYICDKTGESSIVSISHSQGTTAHLVLVSTRPEYNSKIRLSIMMAPVGFMNNLPPQIKAIAIAGPAINALLESLHINELVKDQSAATDLIKFICSKGIVSYAVCAMGALFPFAGFDPIRIEPEFLNVIFGHYPAATSRKALLHYDQVILRQSLSQYDYGENENELRYGTKTPPEYDLSLVSMKVALIAGKNDQLSRLKDVEDLKSKLPNVVAYEVMEPKLWSHLDYVWGNDMNETLYPTLFQVLEDNSIVHFDASAESMSLLHEYRDILPRAAGEWQDSVRVK